MRKKKKEVDAVLCVRGVRSTSEARFLLAVFFFSLFLFSSLPAHAQFYGPLSNPTNSAGASLVVSSTRALGIVTSTVYSTQPSLTFRTQGGVNQHIIFLPNGKVGIATSTPTSTLTVAGDIFATGNIYGSGFIGGVSGAVLAGNVSSDVFGSLQGNGNFAFPASLGVATSSKAGLPQPLSVYGGGYFSGNVGIGTTNPGALLHVVGNSSTELTSLILQNSYSPLVTTKSVSILFKGIDTVGTVKDTAKIVTMPADGNWIGSHLVFQTKDSVDEVVKERVRILNNGNVGIGTTNPGYKLDVQGTGYFDDQLQARGLSLVGTSSVVLSGGNISGVNKLTVTTIDPLYDIRGVRYATYAPSVVGGVYEEYVGRGILKTKDKGKETNDQPEYEYAIDFDAVEEGSDLWVWRSIIADDLREVEVLATPRGGRAAVWYEVKGNRIVFRGDAPAAFSFRLVGRRFDWRDHPTRARDQSEPAGLSVP